LTAIARITIVGGRVGSELDANRSTIAVLRHSDGVVQIREVGGGRRRVTVRPFDDAVQLKARTCETRDPVSLIEMLLAVKGLGGLCVALIRSDPEWVERVLYHTILGHIAPEELSGKRILDYGCGHGASAVALGQMAPDSEIVGVDLETRLLPIAKARCDLYGVDRVQFIAADTGDSIPSTVGDVDFIVLNAVYEHLLPDERRSLLPALWGRLRPGGVLFVADTPHRYSPVDFHTTGLPLINYLPHRVALLYARRWSRHVEPDATWDLLLRGGIRGGTIGEIESDLKSAEDGSVQRLAPCRLGLQDEFDLWLALPAPGLPPIVRRSARVGLRAVKRLTGMSFVPVIATAFRKA
jgi:2-polyprenyl-3-methyl-5-hydroxy-6-metoxy-1,4-benzoquinol methylase